MDSLRIEELVKILSSERRTVKYLFEKKNSRDTDTVHSATTQDSTCRQKKNPMQKMQKDHDFLKPTCLTGSESAMQNGSCSSSSSKSAPGKNHKSSQAGI